MEVNDITEKIIGCLYQVSNSICAPQDCLFVFWSIFIAQNSKSNESFLMTLEKLESLNSSNLIRVYLCSSVVKK